MSIIGADYSNRNALHNGETITVDGRSYRKIDGSIQKGDLYFAQRNQGPKILTARSINVEDSWVVPNEPAYVYDLDECVKVEEI